MLQGTVYGLAHPLKAMLKAAPSVLCHQLASLMAPAAGQLHQQRGKHAWWPGVALDAAASQLTTLLHQHQLLQLGLDAAAGIVLESQPCCGSLHGTLQHRLPAGHDADAQCLHLQDEECSL
jgi:hypothetical protein